VDLTTLITFGGLLFGLIIGDAAFLGDSLYVSISIPSHMESAGFSKATAEQTFVAEISRYTDLQAVIPTPSVATSSAPALPVALAKPLQLEGVVYAVQAAVRDYGVVSVTASLVEDGKGPGLKMFVTIANPPDLPVAVALEQPDGNPKALIEKAARQTMVTIGPYRVALTDFEDGVSGDPTGFDRSKETIAAGLAQAWDPRPEGASETALLLNLLGMLAMRDGNLAQADEEFAQSKKIPGAYRLAYALISANQAFLAIAQKRPVEAARLYNQAVAVAGSVHNPDIISRVKVLAGLVAWSEGNAATAEQDFRAAIEVIDDDEMPHLYLSQLLADSGDAAAAEIERKAGVEARRFDPKYPAVASTIFLLDPVHGGCRPMF